MKKNPLFVAVSNQKGGVGKSTMLVTLASLLSYSMDRNIAIVDCDSTQRSLFNLRERDMEMVEKNKSIWYSLMSRGLEAAGFILSEGQGRRMRVRLPENLRKPVIMTSFHRLAWDNGCVRCLADHFQCGLCADSHCRR